jgi:4-hydroxy-3-polyprenylbenzoate decarboxylase
VLDQELNCHVDLDDFRLSDLTDLNEYAGRLSYYHHSDFMAPIASGSHLTDGMVICPCSGTTLSGVAHGTSSNLIQRAADVHLKERRTLILVPRETPLSIIQLNNMQQAAEAGAVILPASPGWYHGVHSVEDLVDFVVARILDQLRIPHQLMQRWGGAGDTAGP